MGVQVACAIIIISLVPMTGLIILRVNVIVIC